MTSRARALATRTLPDAWRVEVFRRPEAGDPSGERTLAALAELGVDSVRSVRRGQGFLLSPDLAEPVARRIAVELLVDPVLEELQLVAPGEEPTARASGVHRLLVARRPGVMDPVALTVERAIARSDLAGHAGPAGERSLQDPASSTRSRCLRDPALWTWSRCLRDPV